MSTARDSLVIKNATVEIVYDTNRKKMRARHGSSWVRFPKKLRVHGLRYSVTELRQGQAGSWLACGKITAV